MPREFPRAVRVAEQLKRELSELARRELKDPRVHMFTIMDVEVTRDLAHARVFISMLDEDVSVRAGTLDALNHAAGFLRRELGRHLKMRTVPELRFVYDETGDKAARLDSLLAAAKLSGHPKGDS